MNIRQVVFAMVILLATTSVVRANSYEYKMVLNKDSNLCPGIMAELNRDLAQFKEIRYASHKTFPVVKWRRMSELGSKFSEDSEYRKWQWTKFDINNDHALDLVVRDSNDNSYGPGDLYYYSMVRMTGSGGFVHFNSSLMPFEKPALARSRQLAVISC